jgi:hypothetical protein
MVKAIFLETSLQLNCRQSHFPRIKVVIVAF